MTKVLLMNIPGAVLPSDYPPIAISRVIEGIDPSLNCEASFYNLDYYRPDFDEIKNKIQSCAPKIIGFSAILTPYYAYLKSLSNFIGEKFPDIIQVLGGQMAVISNLILLKTKVDFCVIGESEPTFSNLIRRLKENNFDIKDMGNYTDIKGLGFLRNDLPFFIGYEKEDTQKGLRQFNYKIMSKFTSLDNYIHGVDGQYFKIRLGNSNIKHFLKLLYHDNIHKNLATVFASKGCVGRCTFCHRYYKGYRVTDFNELVNYINALKRDHNVGMILFSEENFGSNKKFTSRLVEYLKTSGLNWAAGGVRVKTVDEETMKTWKEAGCVHINFGIESFSQKMLDIMEKNATVEENMNAIRMCYKYKIFTVPGMVLGMPGETEETIEETINKFSTLIPDDMDFPFANYINFVQAIPGMPLYGYAKRLGFIGRSIEEEEKYIESLYDVNANEIKHYLNFTDYEKEEIAYWWYYVYLELIAAYIEKFGYINVLKHKKTKQYKAGLIYILLPRKMRKFLLKYIVLVKDFGAKGLVHIIIKKVIKIFNNKKAERFKEVNRSLRKINSEIPLSLREDEVSLPQ
ncbi:MAG: radical SAM protein [Elusimicrobia bacterium]|nr:radical SAM protein [Elusimicrobiota bacterium]